MNIVVLLALALVAAAPVPVQRGPLYGMIVVIDPGHGGHDPGSHAIFGGKHVVEDEYVYDVALRLKRMLLGKDAMVFMTIRDPEQTRPDARPAQDVIPPDRNEVFMSYQNLVRSTGVRVSATRNGLRQRVRYANAVLDRYPRHRVVFVSLHFDSNGSKQLEGAHVIAPRTDLELATFLVDAFRSDGQGNRLRRLSGREYHPLVRNGDPSHGLRSLYVLRDHNRIGQRVLVELGNFSSEADVWRIRDYRIRERYAQLVLRALMRLNEQPLSCCR